MLKRIYFREISSGDSVGASKDSETNLISIYHKLMGVTQIAFLYPHQLQTILDNLKDGVEE